MYVYLVCSIYSLFSAKAESQLHVLESIMVGSIFCSNWANL